MSNDETLANMGRVIETEILIIGGGISGLWAANRAKEFVDDVLIVDKGPLDWGGEASFAGGDFEAVLPGENVDDWVKDLVYYYDGLCDQELVEEIFKHSNERFEDYQRFGCEFLTGPDGKLKGIPQRALDHVKLYPARLKGTGGADMVRGVINEANRLGVKRLSRTLITDLLKHDGTVAGAVGFDTINGDFYIFKAGAVVLATGSGTWKPSYSGNTSTGEGLLMAYNAGAELRNCEFGRVHNVPRLFAWESQTTLLPLGARFINARGEPFMDNYSPRFGANTDPIYNVIGMAIEWREGRGPIFFDISPMNPEDIEMVKPQTGNQRLNYEKLLEVGIDFFNEKTEWMPAPSGSHAGIIVDTKGRTKVPGLFAAGVTWAVSPGVYMGGFNLCRTAVSGHIVGESVAEYFKSHGRLDIDEDEVKAFRQALYARMGQSGIPPAEVLREIREIAFPYDVCIVKNEKSLQTALDKFGVVKDQLLPQMVATDAHYLLKLIEVRGIAFMTELFLRASLIRKESRAGHYREDYPERDDNNWLKWIIASQKDGEPDLRTEPLPFERYRFRPTRYYMDNFKFPIARQNT